MTQAELLELEAFFKTINLPESIQLSPGIYLPDVELYLQKAFAALKQADFSTPGMATRINGLLKLKELITTPTK